MRFDYSQPVVGNGIDKYGNPRQMRYQRSDAIDEWAVLIGDYDDVDNRVMQDVLKQVKYFQPKDAACRRRGFDAEFQRVAPVAEASQS